MSDSTAGLFFTFGFGLVCIGIILLISVTLLAIFKQSKKAKTQTAGVILIGPIPIIFGNDKKALRTLLILSLILTILLIIATMIYYLFMQR